MKKLLPIAVIMIVMAYAIASEVQIKWTHGGTSNTVAGYNIYYGPASKTYTNSVVTGFVTNTVLSNLPPNSTLFVSGATIGFDGLQTDLGNEIRITTSGTSNTIPSSVKDFRLVRVDKNIY